MTAKVVLSNLSYRIIKGKNSSSSILYLNRGEGQVAVGGTGGAELDAGGEVGHQRHLQLAIGDGLAEVEVAGAGGDGPAHAAHVVARGVEAGLAQLAAMTRHEAPVVALQHPVEAAAHVELHATQHRVGGQPVANRPAGAPSCQRTAA